MAFNRNISILRLQETFYLEKKGVLFYCDTLNEIAHTELD